MLIEDTLKFNIGDIAYTKEWDEDGTHIKLFPHIVVGWKYGGFYNPEFEGTVTDILYDIVSASYNVAGEGVRAFPGKSSRRESELYKKDQILGLITKDLEETEQVYRFTVSKHRKMPIGADKE